MLDYIGNSFVTTKRLSTL